MNYTAKDEKLIAELHDQLLRSCEEKIIKSEEDRNIIQKAFYTAKEAHKGVNRRAGGPYVLHPIAVAQIVVDEIGLGVRSVAAALLHDVVEDAEYTIKDIEVMFGEKIASMVDGLTKMSGIFHADTSEQAENFRKMLLTLSDDVRVIIIKIADRLHNMRTLDAMPLHKQVKISSETKFLFAPLAYRLGLYAIMTELDDLSFKYSHPEQYIEIEHKLKITEKSRQQYIEEFNSPITKILSDSNIDFEISGRIKSIWSIWTKMQRKHIPFEEVYDIFAIRIVFNPSPLIPEKSQCWHIYSLITDIYLPKDSRTRDWVSMPKANGYEALHATLMGPQGTWVEVQIRSQRMEDIAERGYAAHWKYKNISVDEIDEDELDKSLIRIREALSNPTGDAVEFLDNFKMTLYTTEIVVFTPKGESRKLPQGATALDFAYDIHSKIGEKAIGAKINQKIESIFTPINSGDQIEIITSESAHPKSDWLAHVTTARAKQSIRSFLRREHLANLESGIEKFNRNVSKLKISLNEELIDKLLSQYDLVSMDELYIKLGEGTIQENSLLKVLKPSSASKFLLVNPLKIFSGGGGEKKKSQEEEKERERSNIELSELEFYVATCCNPIPGDSVIGYRNPQSQKIDVHKMTCEELVKLAAQHGDRITTIKWSEPESQAYLSIIDLRGIDRKGVLMEIGQVISGELDLSIRELHLQSHNGIFEGQVSIYVKNRDQLNSILEKVGAIKGVDKVQRVGELNSTIS